MLHTTFLVDLNNRIVWTLCFYHWIHTFTLKATKIWLENFSCRAGKWSCNKFYLTNKLLARSLTFLLKPAFIRLLLREMFINLLPLDFLYLNFINYSICLYRFWIIISPQAAFTCSKSTIETPEQCVKSVQS